MRDGGTLPGGSYALPWDGRDADGHVVNAGVYIVRVHAGDDFGARRLIRVR